MNNFHRIIWYHKCVCGILLRKLKKYSKYTMKTCQENLWHIYMMGYFNLVIGWRMQGWLKGQSHILKTAIMVPRKRLSRAIPLHSDPAGDRRARPSPAGPECKKFLKKTPQKPCSHAADGLVSHKGQVIISTWLMMLRLFYCLMVKIDQACYHSLHIIS